MTDTVNVLREVELKDAPFGYDTYEAGAWVDGWNACRDAALAAAPKAEPVSDPYKFEDEIKWLREAARYFSSRDTGGEDRGHWANVYNAENANKIADHLAKLMNTQPEAPKVEQEPVAWTETFIAEEEDGPAVGILIDMPDGSQIWTGEVSDALLNASNERPDESGIFLVVARKSEGMRVVASVATPEDGFELARLIASRAPHTHPAPASDELLEALERADAAIGGGDIAKIRHSEGGVDLAKKVVDLKAASQNFIAKHKGPQS